MQPPDRARKDNACPAEYRAGAWRDWILVVVWCHGPGGPASGSAGLGGGAGIMQRGIAGVGIVLRAVPGRDVGIARAGWEQHQGMAIEFGQRLALPCGFQFRIAALEDAPGAELLQFETGDGVGNLVWLQLGSELARGERRIFGRQGDVVEIGPSAL